MNRLLLKSSTGPKKWVACCNIVAGGGLFVAFMVAFSAISFIAFYQASTGPRTPDFNWLTIGLSFVFVLVSLLIWVKVMPACFRKAAAEFKSEYTLQADETALTIMDGNGHIYAFPWGEIRGFGIRNTGIGCHAVTIYAKKSFAFGLLLRMGDLIAACDWIDTELKQHRK